MSPVQDGTKKPQIDSNKSNNYRIVKEVSIENPGFADMFSLLFSTVLLAVFLPSTDSDSAEQTLCAEQEEPEPAPTPTEEHGCPLGGAGPSSDSL